jgi:hypothetical protein
MNEKWQDREVSISTVYQKKIDKRGRYKSISHVRRVAYSTVDYTVGPGVVN